ncbi:hypothetical protein ACLB1S_08050 [Escherichia coli]
MLLSTASLSTITYCLLFNLS